MTVCYFTATGNCLYVARRIGGTLLSIPQLMKQDKIEISDDAVGIVCPTYAGEMPKMVRAFMEKAVVKTDYLFFIATFGMYETVVRAHAKAVADKAGLDLAYVNAVKMVDNYLPGFEMQNQMDTLPEKNVEGQIDAVVADISARKRNGNDTNPLKKAGLAAVHGIVAHTMLKGSAAKAYIVNDSCIRCGICAKVCPADNITVKDKVEFGDRCEVCYACIHNCPKNALHLKNEKSAVRFRNEHIAVKDIVEANG